MECYSYITKLTKTFYPRCQQSSNYKFWLTDNVVPNCSVWIWILSLWGGLSCLRSGKISTPVPVVVGGVHTSLPRHSLHAWTGCRRICVTVSALSIPTWMGGLLIGIWRISRTLGWFILFGQRILFVDCITWIDLTLSSMWSWLTITNLLLLLFPWLVYH